MMIKIRLAVGLVLLWLIFQLAFSLGQGLQAKINTDRFIDSIEKRIALDLPKLRLANPRFKTVADTASIKTYMLSLNAALGSLTSNVYLSSIQGIALPNKPNSDALTTYLRTADQQIELRFRRLPQSTFSHLNLYAPLMALLIILFSHTKARKLNNQAQASLTNSKQDIAPLGKLVINLRDKSIHYDSDHVIIALPNKPFCFYAALVDYCLLNNTACLRHNNDVPEELLLLANKYFYRLIELGHTKRKRPDFSANLDKTLSEIRSALDDVFQNHADIKELFYPPKAQGEGSRSKMHNYALVNADPQRVEFIGK